MTREEVIGMLGRPPDAEWDRAVGPRDGAGYLPAGPGYLPVGATVHYLQWDTEGESILVRLYEGRVVNKGATNSQPKTAWRQAVHALRSGRSLDSSQGASSQPAGPSQGPSDPVSRWLTAPISR
jgi:hypothetical protein